MVAEVFGGVAQGDDLSVGGGVGVGQVAIPSAADDFVLVNDYCSYWDVSGFERALGGAEGFFHPEFVVGPFASLRAG
jgi:hypothetical protein